MVQILVGFYAIASFVTALFFWQAFRVAKRAECMEYEQVLALDSETAKRTGRSPYELDSAN